MKNFKRLLFVLTAAAVILFAAACGNNEALDVNNDVTNDSPSENIPVIDEQIADDEELRYAVKSVVLIQDNPPFGKYALSNSEINELLDCLSSIDLSLYPIETEILVGEHLSAYITADDGTEYIVSFISPDLCLPGTRYILGADHEIFEITNRFESEHLN